MIPIDMKIYLDNPAKAYFAGEATVGHIKLNLPKKAMVMSKYNLFFNFGFFLSKQKV